MKYKRQLPEDTLNIISDGESMPTFHNYEKELKRLYLEGKLKKGEFTVLDIAHDDWCDIYNRDRCNCKPIIQNRITKQIIS